MSDLSSAIQAAKQSTVTAAQARLLLAVAAAGGTAGARMVAEQLSVDELRAVEACLESFLARKTRR